MKGGFTKEEAKRLTQLREKGKEEWQMLIEVEGRTKMETKLENDKKRTIVSMSN